MTHLPLLFFIIFSVAFMATAPPGLLNMNTARTAVQKGKKYGLIFAAGVSITVVLQAWVAVRISLFLYKNPGVIDWLLKLAIGVFLFFAVYFFLAARRGQKKKIKEVKISKRNSFFKGVLLASLNMLTIPFYSGMNAALKVSGQMGFDWPDILTFILAAGCGTFTMLYMYIVYFNRLTNKNTRFSRYSDYVLSVLMLVLVVITLIRIFYR